MIKPTEEQIEFIRREFGIERRGLENISREAWRKIREDCFSIECDETTSAGCSERGEMAADIADIRYKELFK